MFAKIIRSVISLLTLNSPPRALPVLLLALSLGSAHPLFAQGGVINLQVTQPPPPVGTGGPASNATVVICPYSTGSGTPCSPTANLFSDLALTPTHAIPNPTSTDIFGNLSVFVNAGVYLTQVTPVAGTTYNYIVEAVSGTVTSITISGPSIFTFTNCTITLSGTCVIGLASEPANYVWAAPNGSSGLPAFRNLVGPDFGVQPAYTVLGNPTSSATSPFFTLLNANMIPPTLGPTNFIGNVSVTGAFTTPSGSVNGTCVANPSLAIALTCAGTSGVVEIPMTAVAPLTANTTVPSGVALKFDGPSCIPLNGFTLTINGPVNAPATSQIFCGSGSVTGLGSVHPEWFGSTAINPAVQSALGSGGGTLVLQPNTNYQSSFTSACWTLSNVTIQGGGEPVANSAYTALVSGTVIQGGMCFLGASEIRITNVGFDNGAAYAGTSANDALALCGATCSNPAEPLITGIYIENVDCMLSSGAAAFHCMRVEHGSGATIKNVTAYFGTHGLAIKSDNSILVGLTTYGQSSDGLIIKGDNYTGTANVVASHVIAQTINSSNILHDGVVLDAEQAGTLSNVTVSDVQVYDAQAGLAIISNGTFGTGALNALNVSNFLYEYGQGALGLSNTNCVLAAGAAGQIATWVHLNHFTCINGPSAAHFPFNVTLKLTNSVIENVLSAGSNSTGSTLEGNALYVNNWIETNSTDSRPFFVTGTSSVYLTNYQGTALINQSIVDAGSTFYYESQNTSNTGYLITNNGTVPLAVTNGAGTLNFFQIDNNGNAIPNGHLNQTGGGHFAGSNTSPFTITFTQPFNSTPVCTVTDASASPGLVTISAFSSTGFTATGTSGHNLNWICVGNPN